MYNGTHILFAALEICKSILMWVIGFSPLEKALFLGESVNVEYKVECDLNIVNDSLGYMILEKVDTIENDTHTLFIGRLIEADLYKDEPAMTYNYYQEHKDEFIKVSNRK